LQITFPTAADVTNCSMQKAPTGEELVYLISLTQVPHLGDVHVSALLKHFGSASSVFRAAKRELECLPGIGTVRAGAIKSFRGHARSEQELGYCDKQGIQLLVRGFHGYPVRLAHCPDAPAVLFFKGSSVLDLPKVVSIVGTRSPTHYGKSSVQELIAAIAPLQVLVVSGLAYGIDTLVHREALKQGLATVGVLGHGLDKLYPNANRQLSEEMLACGGLLTEFMMGTQPDRQHFPMRNRIVSGMADAVVVVESGIKGGSLITADLANDYNRDVLAYPGRASDEQSMGCNALIRTHKANLVTSGQELIDFLNWSDRNKKDTVVQMALFDGLGDAEKKLVAILTKHQPVSIDQLAREADLKPNTAASMLLDLEMQGVVVALPGKMYALCRS
jgi:DNA processing protein